MSKKEWFRELPYEEDSEDEDYWVDYIISEMASPDGLNLCPTEDRTKYKDALRWLLRAAREVHRLELSDWLRRHEPEGTDWRPHRRLRKNLDPDEPEVPYDYGAATGEGLDDWDKHWRESWSPARYPWRTARGQPGLFRRKVSQQPDRWAATDIPKQPLVSVYYEVNWWYRHVVADLAKHEASHGRSMPDPRFNPDFKPWRDYQVESRESGEAPLSKLEGLHHLNPAARLYFLVANSLDSRYSIDLCKKVHDDYYRHLDTSVE